MRRAGYGYIRDRRTGHDSYVRRLGNGFYPRLHMYAEERDGQAVFNLHLDQKQASYEGAHMHNAEYDGPVVEGEINRLKSFIGAAGNDNNQKLARQNGDLLNSIRENSQASFGKGEKSEMKKKVWWKFWE